MLVIRFLITVLQWLVRPRSAAPSQSIVARVQIDVMSGARPALKVVRERDGSWEVSDGWSDVSAPDAAVRATLSHAALWDNSIADLRTMKPGTVARRPNPKGPWSVSSIYL